MSREHGDRRRPGPYIAQNGIQFSRGATGNVGREHRHRATRTRRRPTSSSTGVLLFEAGSGLVVNNNDVREQRRQHRPLRRVTGVTVHQNAAQDSTEFDGALRRRRHVRQPVHRELRRRATRRFDCEDLSSRSHVPPVANTWTDNTGTTSSPPGICTPPVGARPEPRARRRRRRRPATAVQPGGLIV